MAKMTGRGGEDEIFYLDERAKGTRVAPDDSVIGIDEERVKVRDFWQWAFSDLADDALKGDYVEWLVSILLGIRTEPRKYYANTDFISLEGVRIEVKSSAFWQSWKFRNEDGGPKPLRIAGEKEEQRIRFAGLKVADASGDVGYKSDLYVFALQAERDPRKWNALDLSQWEFYMLPRQTLELEGCLSISLLRVRKLFGPAMTAGEFRVRGRDKLREIAASKEGTRFAVGQGG